MKDVILIHSAGELLTISDMSANYKLACDIDLEGKSFKPLGNAEVPFSGTFDGGKHIISNVKIDAGLYPAAGLFGVMEGYAYDITVKNLDIYGLVAADGVIGSVVGINYGKLANVNIESGSINVNVTGKGNLLVLGGIAGESHDEIRNCLSAADVTVNTDGARVIAGGIVGVAEYGFLETLKATGRFAFTGNEKLLNVGVIAGHVQNVILMANKFEAPMNTVNGAVYTKLYVKEKEVTREGNIWRDNRNDDSFLPEGELALRKEALEHMTRMATCEWNLNGKKEYGLPYGHLCRSYEQFKDSIDEDGNPKAFVKKEGLNGLDMSMGVDCVGAMYWAWSRISDKIKFRSLKDMRPDQHKGVIGIGKIDMDFEDADTNAIWETIYDGRKKPVMWEALATLHIGDAVMKDWGSGHHVAMVAKSAVTFRNEEGDILHPYSYVELIGQGAKFQSTNYTESPSESWVTGRPFWFIRFGTEKYIPITIPEFKKGKKALEKIEVKSADGVNCVTDGKVKSNYRIISTQAVISDKKTGKVVFEKKLFTANHPFIYTEKEISACENVKSVDLSEYTPYFAGVRIPKGRYKYVLYCTLSTGNTFAAIEKEFSL